MLSIIGWELALPCEPKHACINVVINYIRYLGRRNFMNQLNDFWFI